MGGNVAVLNGVLFCVSCSWVGGMLGVFCWDALNIVSSVAITGSQAVSGSPQCWCSGHDPSTYLPLRFTCRTGFMSIWIHSFFGSFYWSVVEKAEKNNFGKRKGAFSGAVPPHCMCDKAEHQSQEILEFGKQAGSRAQEGLWLQHIYRRNIS